MNKYVLFFEEEEEQQMLANLIEWAQGPDIYCETCVDDEGDPIELVYVVGSDKSWYNGSHTARSSDFACPSCNGVWTERCD